MSLNGRVNLARTRWQTVGGQAGGTCVMPLDAFLDAAENTLSLGLRELCCRLGIAGGSYERSVENLYRAANLRLSEELFRQVVESEGKAVVKAAREELLPVDWSAKECLTQTPEGQSVARVYASADGVFVPMTTQAEKDKRRETVKKKRREKRPKKGRRRLPAVKLGMDQRYKQLYLASFYNQEKSRRLVSVTRGGHADLGKVLGRDAALIRLAAADEKVGLVDGAVCLKRNLEGLGLSAVGLDFCHLAGHVGAADRELAGLKPPAARRAAAETATDSSALETSAASLPAGAVAHRSPWVCDVLSTVKHEGYDPFWDKLVARRNAVSRGRRKIADKLLHYVSQRQEMIAYNTFLEKGWDIGTGPMEAMCKSTTRRIKGSGMRWNADNAEAMVALEALYQSHQWDAWWTKTRCSMN